MSKGFVLVSCLLAMSLLAILSIGMIQISHVEIKNTTYELAQKEAESNARFALQMALAQLQEMTGPDQIVTARADIFSDEQEVPNPNWIGSWKTTYQENDEGVNWPLIGKKTENANEIYAFKGTFSDLRHTVPSLADGNWKKHLLNGWLVSSPSQMTNPFTSYSVTDPSVVELFGKGSLGDLNTEDDLNLKSVRVKKISISDKASIAWWITDNNQKASITPHSPNDAENAIISSAGNDLSLIQYENDFPFIDFYDQSYLHKDKLISLASSHLTQGPGQNTRVMLKHFSHDLTNYAPGMYINTNLGGFQRDLTPLLFAHSEDKIISLIPPNERIHDRSFSSEYPIINSTYHDVLAPTFSALRHWGLQKYTTENTIATNLASYASRQRLGNHWPHTQSDGITFDARYWATEMPKIHPFMTDARWHYYFSINGKNIRTHLIPRVCLWNPYNREMKVNQMVVMMPNPFYKSSGGFHFYVEDDEVERLRIELPDTSLPIHSWVKKYVSPIGYQFKARLFTKDIFPQQRYLTFVLNETTLAAGECHVFSPKISSPEIISNNVHLSHYDVNNLSNNVLSSDSEQGGDHFYFDMNDTQFEVQTAHSWKLLTNEEQDKLQLHKVHDYRPETGKITENFPFILKASNSIITDYNTLLNSVDHPTLQLINNGTGGVAPSYYFSYTGSSWGSANTISSFGSLQNFGDAPYKDAPATHQVGAKLVWLDEASTEGNRAPLRYGTSTQTRWPSDHMAYHPATIANWNVRAHLTSRSPVAQCAKKWYLFSTGPWILQFIPKSPQDINDSPQLNALGTAFVKNPFGLSVNHTSAPNVVLFDLPHSEYGIHSLAALRHAMLSPYSWHPSYVIGHSLRDPHAPAASTAHPDVILSTESTVTNHWDHHIGGYRAGYDYGAANETSASDDLLQLGTSAITRSMDDNVLTSENDVLPYDIAYEVNQSLWDGYFISSLPLSETTESFASIIPSNQRCEVQSNTGISRDILTENLTSDENSIGEAFWLNGYYYRKVNAFNVNSTSIPAWIAILSGTFQTQCELQDGSFSGNQRVTFTRHKHPIREANANRLNPDQLDAWTGMRSLTNDEISRLAHAVVDEVKLRGPFISLADFVNRRLSHADDETSHMGALDAAIFKSGLNQVFYDDPTYTTRVVNSGTDGDSRDNNQSLFRETYLYSSGGETRTSQAPIKTWGLPSFLMQSDILEPLAPIFTVRGDTFTIRAYGESKRNGKVIATAYIEAVVERSPHYIDHQNITHTNDSPSKNLPTDPALNQDPLTGEISTGNLTEINKKLGRKYRIKSFRWLSKNEI